MNLLNIFKIKQTYKITFILLGLTVFISSNLTLFAQKKDFVVVLDAGHGGKDPGKVGYKKYKEKDIALKLVLQVGKLLKKQKGIRVVYTRKKDVFIDLWERGRIANKADADLFISIHCNAHHTKAHGAETWVLGTSANKKNFEVAKAENSVILLEDNYEKNYKGFDPNSPESIIGLTLLQEEYLDESIKLASIVQDGFTKKLRRKNRGVKQNIFVVLHQTYMPSILIEAGFITNKKEALFLASKKGQTRYATSIAESILKYKKQLAINTIATKKETSKPKTAKKPKEVVISKNVLFKVQIASGKKLSLKPYNFKGLRGVERVKSGKIYRYYYGNTSSYTKVKSNLQKAKNKGYTSAFITAFKNGKKVSVTSVLKKS